MTQTLKKSAQATRRKPTTGQADSKATIAQPAPKPPSTQRTRKAHSQEGRTEEPDQPDVPEVSSESSPKKATRKRAARSQPRPAPAVEPGMQVICAQSAFYGAVAIASCTAPTRPSHPVLANALVVADVQAQQVHLTVTDLAMTMQASFEAEVLVGGELTVPVEILANMVKQFPPGSITLNSQTQMIESVSAEEQPLKTGVITLADTNGKYEICGIPAEEFPPIAIVTADPMALPALAFKEGLKSVLYAVSLDETKHILTGVHIHVGQNVLKFTATDGHRVALAEIAVELTHRFKQGKARRRRQPAEVHEPIQFPISGKALKEVLRNLTDSVETIQLAYDAQATRARFAWQDIALSCQCIEGQYPDCEQLLARFSFGRAVTLEKSGLLKALERLSVLTDKKERGIQFRFNGATQQVWLSIEREFGRGDETMTADMPTDMALEIQFNLKYLVEAVKAIPSSAIKLHLKQPDYPAMLVPGGDFNDPELEMSMHHFLFPLYKQPE
jgi:DNA polymerase III subunit beta